jgi:hypothetical protein
VGHTAAAGMWRRRPAGWRHLPAFGEAYVRTTPRERALADVFPLVVCPSPPQAFINTAQKIYEKILNGTYDVTNEAYGIKVGSGANAAGGGNINLARGGKQPSKSDGGCC